MSKEGIKEEIVVRDEFRKAIGAGLDTFETLKGHLSVEEEDKLKAAILKATHLYITIEDKETE